MASLTKCDIRDKNDKCNKIWPITYVTRLDKFDKIWPVWNNMTRQQNIFVKTWQVWQNMTGKTTCDNNTKFDKFEKTGEVWQNVTKPEKNYKHDKTIQTQQNVTK